MTIAETTPPLPNPPRSGLAARPDRSAGLVLLGSAAALVVAAGLLLWWGQGEAVFGSYLAAALAWCF